jgi:hypothetical protein
MDVARVTLAIALLANAGCATESATQVVVDDDYAPVPDGGDPRTEMTVYKVWWSTTLLPDAVRPGAEGQTQRTVPNRDFAYAVLAPGWDPSSGSPPTRFLAAKSLGALTASRGDTLHVHVSDLTFAGDCASGAPLGQSDADEVTQRIFPAEFAGLTYDAATCTATPSPTDAGIADATEAGDAGPTDAGIADAAEAGDAGPTDAGATE